MGEEGAAGPGLALRSSPSLYPQLHKRRPSTHQVPVVTRLDGVECCELDGDGSVGVTDFLILLANRG
jgi:hypothetical protein